jgi:hypothetical protein
MATLQEVDFDPFGGGKTSTPADFGKVYGPVAERIGAQIGVDPKMVLGQLGVETGWGKSIIPGTNNLGNIKDFSGGGTAATDNMTGSRDKYRTYATPEAFADDYASLIQRKYPRAVGAKTPEAFAAALKAGGYAEDPNYAGKVARAARTPGLLQRAVESVIPSANAATLQEVDFDPFAAPGGGTAGVPRVEVRGTADSPEPGDRRGAVANALYRTANAVTPFGGVLNLIGSGDPIQDAKNMFAGGLRGSGSIGTTAISGVRGALGMLGVPEEFLPIPGPERRRAMDEALRNMGAETQTGMFQLGKLGAEVAGTSGVGPGLAAGVSRLAGAVPQIGRFAGPLANALQSGGTVTGLSPKGLGHLADIGYRGIGGALAGGASAAAIDPETAGEGAGIGALIGPGLKLAGGLGDVAGRAINYARNGPAPRDAQTILDIGGYTAQQIPEVRAALAQQGPQIINAPRTVPQILAGGRPTAEGMQPNGAIAQFGRTMRNAGDQAGLRAEQLQDMARTEALNRVAPVAPSTVEAGADFGIHFRPKVKAADESARAATERAFNAVDPNPVPESKFLLPIDKLKAAQNEFLGPGTFGTGRDAAAAIKEAERIGTQELPAVAPVKVVKRQGEDLFTAMRALGGIKQDSAGAKLFAGEIKDLKQSGARAVIQNGRGQSPDTLAQSMHARGFIDDPDPATLFNAMREHAAGRKVFSVASDRRGALRAGVEAAQGDAPGAERIAKTVPFKEVQSLRSSIGEAWQNAVDNKATKEAAALNKMREEIDSAVENVASGGGHESEFFPRDMVDQWRKALKMHADRMGKYREGPVSNVFRENVDDAGLAGHFYSARPSQANDVRAFKGVADPDSLALLKSYATTGAAGKRDVLTSAQFNDFLKARAGANAELFTDAEQAHLRAIGGSLKEADRATRLGMATGSPTEQNRIATAMSLGALDSRAATLAAKAIPYIGTPALEGIRNVVTKAKVNRLGRLMADPVELERAIARLQQLRAQGAALNLGGTAGLAPMIGRSLPPLLSGQ